MNINVNYEQPKKIWNVMFISIFIANLSMNLGQMMSNSLLSLYAKSLDAPAQQIGQLMSMFAVTALIFRFISGPAMNAYDRKKLLMMAMCFMGIAYLGFSFAPTISSIVGIDTITILKIFRMIQGVGNAFGNSCCMAIVSDVLPKDRFNTGIGYYTCAQVVAQAIGPTIGVALKNVFGYQKVYLLFFCVMAFAVLMASRVKTAPRERIPFNLKFKNMIAVEALPPSIITFLIAMGFTSINSFLLVYAEERSIVGGSLFFAVYAVVLLFTRPLVGNLTEKYGITKSGAPCTLMTAISLAIIGFSTNLPMLLIGAFVNAFGYGAVQPMLQSLSLKSVPDSRRGSASSTNFIAMDLATIIGPSICGDVAGAVGYTEKMWLFMTIPILSGFVFMIITRKKLSAIESAFEHNSKTDNKES